MPDPIKRSVPGSGTGTLGSRKLVPYWKLTLVTVPSVKYPGVRPVSVNITEFKYVRTAL